MVVIRSVNEIILSLIDFFKIAQPGLDTKPATVARDLLIDAPSNQLALLYDQVSQVSTQQSLRLVIGSDLDKLAKNFGATRKTSIPSSGVALFTFSSLPATVAINRGELITAANGFSFSVLNGIAVNPSNSNFYKSTATKYRNDLDFVGISDQYAVEVTVQATTSGTSGNISKYGLNRTTAAGVSNVTNANAFIGGADQEDDTTFRNRVLAIFSGSSVGTALGYKNTALTTTGVIDAFVVEPGDPLMTRDGTVVTEDGTGNLTVVSEGTGGKVDIVILGSNLTENVDSFIYKDKSNNNDPSDPKNVIILGQIVGDENKTINRRRIDDIKNKTVPSQPVESVIQVNGSSSGSNFKEKTVDSLGRVSGNYELIKDTGVYAGSPWGFDSFAWVNDRIDLFEEDRIKGKFNGQDAVTFTDVLEIPNLQQNISITNENSNVQTSDRSLLQLLHAPLTNVTRVFNSTTGERYTVVNQNPNGTGTTNTSGIIKISGNTLPSQSDILQVDYNWIVIFDQFSDYDGRLFTNNLRSVTDSIDWGYSNLIRKEIVNIQENVSSTFFIGNTSLPISSVVAVNKFLEIDGGVTTIVSGTFTGRLAVVIENLIDLTTSVNSVVLKNTNTEVYSTAQNDGVFSNASIVVGLYVQYVTTIILPIDTKAIAGDKVTAILNLEDIFNITNSTGNFNSNQITIPSENITTTATAINVRVDYISSIQDIISTGITSIPFSRIGNGFSTSNSVGFNNTNFTNVNRRENQSVQDNGSNRFIDLSISSLDVASTSIKVISVIRLSDFKELWNADNEGTIDVNGNNNYQLILNGFNTPVIGDKVLIVYYAEDIKRFQPFTFSNKIFEKDFDTLQYDIVSDNFSVNIHAFVSESGLSWEILEPNTDIIISSNTDGYIIANGLDATFGSISANFATLVDVNSNPINITSKKIRILNSANKNNNGIYDITSYNSLTNSFVISNNFNKINKRQISIIRILDGKELWSDSGTIDLIGGKLLFPKTTSANTLDTVLIIYYDYDTCKQAPTKAVITVSDSIANPGVLTIAGTTITKAQDIVFSATSSGLKQPLFEAMRKALTINSSASIPSNIKLVKIAKLERVTTTNTTSDDVLLVNSSYDLFGTTIQDNGFYSNDFISDLTLSSLEFILPATTANITNLAAQVKVGDKFRITFYYSKSSDTENIIFTKNGTLYTNKSFALIDKVYVSSGFGSSQSTKIAISNFNQPITGSRYKVFYDYLSPKQNERITIRFNSNKLIADTTFNVENNRPINADVLIRQAKQVDIDVTMNIVIADQFLSSSALVVQNTIDALISTINSSTLGASLDSSKLINTAFSVEGIAGARIIFFNKTGSPGNTLKINTKADEFLVANSITVTPETR